mmetsp:Transcript_1874/g.2061  ORF Transcript_1874/g.2061 Transcript_1874/m.2061 type:complete len:461 (-) Transcript_1874:35-1417(-)
MHLLLLLLVIGLATAQYTPTWPSLNQRPTPSWFKDAKFGVFIHWGIYSVPSIGFPGWRPTPDLDGGYAEWYWYFTREFPDGPYAAYDAKTYGPDHKYEEFARSDQFRADLWDPDAWAKLFKDSGARYVTMTSKHHDGYCLWPNKESGEWNSVDSGPKRDLFGELATALRKEDIKVGAYYSLYEWYNTLYVGPTPQRYVDEIMLPQLKDLISRYRPDNLYVDGEWEHDSDFWKSKDFLAWLFNESSVKDTIAVNDRWGSETRGKDGGYYVCEFGGLSEFCPVEDIVDHPWEDTLGMGYSFGYNRNETSEDYNDAAFFIRLLCDLVSKGGNLDLNVGPRADGMIDPIMEERLRSIGKWLSINGEAIYESTPWQVFGEGDKIRYTRKGTTVYTLLQEWPETYVRLNAVTPTSDTTVQMLGAGAGFLQYTALSGSGMEVVVPLALQSLTTSEHVFVLKITNVKV